jgi:hypothetical protein
MEVLPECCPVVGPEVMARLTSVSNFFERVDEAQQRGRASALNRLPFFAVARSLNARMLRTQIIRAVLEAWDKESDRSRNALKNS